MRLKSDFLKTIRCLLPLHKEQTVNTRFWNTLSNRYAKNCLSWQRGGEALPPGGALWKSTWTANPDFLSLGSRLLLYYRGHGTLPGVDDRRHDRIGVAEVTEIGAGRFTCHDLNGRLPVIDVGAAGAFDSHHALDPAAVLFRERVYLYYSAIGPSADSIGLAVSDDGVQFQKVGRVMEGRAPDAVVHEERLYLTYQRVIEGGGYAVFLAASDDGVQFTPVQGAPVFAGEKGSWDSYSITTARLSRDGDWFYLMYGGSTYLADEPDFFGLARSRDLLTWERHPGNPFFGVNARGTPDGGALWFPALWETPHAFVLLYEGSRGTYAWDLHSTICLAWLVI